MGPAYAMRITLDAKEAASRHFSETLLELAILSRAICTIRTEHTVCRTELSEPNAGNWYPLFRTDN